MNEVKPNNVIELEEGSSPNHTDSSELKLSLDDSQEESTKTQRRTKKFVKAKPKELSGSNQDLSSDFNQY